jgi:hypothetical protein
MTLLRDVWNLAVMLLATMLALSSWPSRDVYTLAVAIWLAVNVKKQR